MLPGLLLGIVLGGLVGGFPVWLLGGVPGGLPGTPCMLLLGGFPLPGVPGALYGGICGGWFALSWLLGGIPGAAPGMLLFGAPGVPLFIWLWASLARVVLRPMGIPADRSAPPDLTTGVFAVERPVPD